MQITESREGHTGVLALSGALDTMSAAALSTQAIAFCGDGASGIRTLLVDLADVPYITSAGFRALLVIRKHTELASIGVALCGFNEVVADLFEASAFDSIFAIYPDRATALVAIAEPGPA